MLVGDGKVLDPREAFNDTGNSSKDVVAKDLVTREAFTNIGSFFFTDDGVTDHFPLGVPSINIDTQYLANKSFRDSEPSSGHLY